MLKDKIISLPKSINLKEANWQYSHDTNCYAFALGLDIPYQLLMDNIYGLGYIGAIIYNIPFDKIKKMTYEERLSLDLKSLNIKLEETDQYDISYIDNNSISWIIAMFQNVISFHFLRKSFQGEWWQKPGYLDPPINTDFSNNKITDITKSNLYSYKLIKTYRLTYHNK